MINYNGHVDLQVRGSVRVAVAARSSRSRAGNTDTGCSMRTVNDIAVVADPATGVAAYVSYIGGWTVFGGTSVSAPLVASMYALAGNGSSINNASSLYANAASFNQVLAVPNGTCTIGYLCDNPANPSGYNAPSGNGTPLGLAGF